MKFCYLLLFVASTYAHSYYPTVESLFRNGSNPEITQNAVVLNLKITPVNPLAEKGEEAQGSSTWVKLIYHVGNGGRVKLSQLVYKSKNMTDSQAYNKIFISEFSPNVFENSPEMGDRGLFYSLLNSLLLNDGYYMTQFLKSRGVNVSSNSELLNQEKKQLLDKHKSWLIRTKGGRQDEGEESPLSPITSLEKERVSQIMSQPMYASTGQVDLVRFDSEASWNIKSETFEAWISDANREIKQLNLRYSTGETVITARDYIKFNGVNPIPRLIVLKNSKDQYYYIEPILLRYFNESGQELVNRLKRYEKDVKQPSEPLVKPYFIF